MVQYRVFFGEGNPCNGAKSSTDFEYLSLSAVFSCFKFKSMGDGEEGYPLLDGHYETIYPTGKKIVRNLNNNTQNRVGAVDVTIPLEKNVE